MTPNKKRALKSNIGKFALVMNWDGKFVEIKDITITAMFYRCTDGAFSHNFKPEELQIIPSIKLGYENRA